MEFKAVIIDDEANLREVISIKVGKLDKDVKIVGQASNAEDGFNLIKAINPDIVFLDITMPNESGLEMMKRFETVDFEVIFVTGHSEYGIEALKMDAIDYLLKPIKSKDLLNAILKAKSKIGNKQKIRQYEELLQRSEESIDQNVKVPIPGSNYYDYIEIYNIIRCEGWQKYTKIHLKNNTSLLSSYNLGVFRELLSKYAFIDVHKSHLINKKHISKYLNEGIIIMSDNSQVPLSRRRRNEFMNEVNKM